ncbi:hypothetical protein [Nonomuraea candida]|uniref:hypothetical protein n=1 Tax=Nonomuraea candida TaxID=359159 RepID=UPI0012FB7BB4|nr:hypothetical protein [Nonomuraea candida]
METDTAALSAREHLDRLRAELAERGWESEIRGTRENPYLRVANPSDPGLNGMVAARGDLFRWTWGPVLGPIRDASVAADVIVTVLREVGP